MTSFFAYLDGLPLAPLVTFLAGWGALLLLVLVVLRSRRHADTCARCGKSWEPTGRGGAHFHFCNKEPDLAHRLLSLSIRGANDHTGPRP